MRPHEATGAYRRLQEYRSLQEHRRLQETTGDYRSTGAQETTGAYREHRSDRKEKDRLADRPQTDHRLADRPRQTQTAADRPRTGRQTAADRPQPPYHYTLQKSTGVQGAYSRLQEHKSEEKNETKTDHPPSLGKSPLAY